MILQSMKDYVLEQVPKCDMDKEIMATDLVFLFNDFANFLSQPLKKGMFSPTDENDNVLEEPEYFNESKGILIYNEDLFNGFFDDIDDFNDWRSNCLIYQSALENVIFDGFCYFEHQSTFVNSRNNNFEYCVFNYTKDKLGICTYTENKGFHTYFNMSTIEDLVKFNLTIKESAVKKYKL